MMQTAIAAGATGFDLFTTSGECRAVFERGTLRVGESAVEPGIAGELAACADQAPRELVLPDGFTLRYEVRRLGRSALRVVFLDMDQTGAPSLFGDSGYEKWLLETASAKVAALKKRSMH